MLSGGARSLSCFPLCNNLCHVCGVKQWTQQRVESCSKILLNGCLMHLAVICRAVWFVVTGCWVTLSRKASTAAKCLKCLPVLPRTACSAPVPRKRACICNLAAILKG